MMSFKVAVVSTLALVLASSGFAQEAAPAEAAEPPKENPELELEIRYVEALVGFGYPDLAEPVIAATKKRWPESEVRFFAIEIRGLLALGKFEEAEKKIAALPDRKSAKYWAARLEVAKNYFFRGKREECMKIYDEFFGAFAKPPPELVSFFRDACFEHGQLLIEDRKFEAAAARYEALLSQLAGGSDEWCNVGCETINIYLRLADETKDPKGKAKREGFLKSALKIIDRLLWLSETQPLYFGRAVAMKAHVEQMRNNDEVAQKVIDDYRPQLEEIHAQIVQNDPDGTVGLLKQSPLPECLYLQAKMRWEEAQVEAKKTPKRDDEKIKACLFGPKGKNGKRVGSKGAFNMSINVFLRFETSAWAPAAGELSETIKAFAEKEYKAKIKTVITPEQIAKVRAAQFREANEKFAVQKYEEATAAYLAVLAKYPEISESISAIENVASCYLDRIVEAEDPADKEAFRIAADAVEGYLLERFAGSKNRLLMTSAGDAVLRLAAIESQRKNQAGADRLYTEFLTNYRTHTSAATLAASKAGSFQKDENYAEAVKYWTILSENYTNSTYYAAALSQLSRCYGKLGDKAREIAYLNRYLDVETVALRRLQAQFQLAKMYQDDGLAILAAAETNATPEAVEAEERRGTAQIVRAIKNFSAFSAAADKALADPGTVKDDRASYQQLKEAAMFMVGECWGRMNRPEKNLKSYRERSVKNFEDYVTAYPEGKYAKPAYVKLGTIYTALGDMAKSKDALDRLSKKFPDSTEAKNAKPRLAKNLIEMGLKREGTEIYAEMLQTDGAYTAGQFVAAGEALVDAKSYDLAAQAFEKAIRLAGTNQVQVAALARLGQAKSSWRQGSFAEAREALDVFLADPTMSKMAIAADANFMLVAVASDQGRAEKDSTLRTKYFNAAVGALKKVRQYWRKRPQWEQDQLDLLSGDVLIDRMKAEESMGLKEDALETCGRAASTFLSFIQSHGPTEAVPLDQMESGARDNLERAYATMLPLMAKRGGELAESVIKYGQQYLEIFPNGKSRTTVENAMNQAKAEMSSPATKAEASEAGAAEAAADVEK